MGWLSAPLCGVCHTTCSSSAFLTAATVSFSQLHSFTPHSVTLHSVAQFISAGFSPPAANFYFARRQPHLGCVHLAAANAHSPLPAHQSLGGGGISQSIAKVHLHSSATSVSAGRRKITSVASYVAAIAPDDRGLYWQHLCGGSPSASIASYLLIPAAVKRLAIPSVRIPKAFGTAQPCFFFAAGAFTGRNTKTKGNQK